jgi:hypothetical protein
LASYFPHNIIVSIIQFSRYVKKIIIRPIRSACREIHTLVPGARELSLIIARIRMSQFIHALLMGGEILFPRSPRTHIRPLEPDDMHCYHSLHLVFCFWSPRTFTTSVDPILAHHKDFTKVLMVDQEGIAPSSEPFILNVSTTLAYYLYHTVAQLSSLFFDISIRNDLIILYHDDVILLQKI